MLNGRPICARNSELICQPSPISRGSACTLGTSYTRVKFTFQGVSKSDGAYPLLTLYGLCAFDRNVPPRLAEPVSKALDQVKLNCPVSPWRSRTLNAVCRLL